MKVLIFGCALFFSLGQLAMAQTVIRETKLPNVKCETKSIKTQGTTIKVGVNFTNLIQYEILKNPSDEVFAAALKGEAAITGYGKASVTVQTSGKIEKTKEKVEKSPVELIDQTNLDKEQFLAAGMKMSELKKIIFLKSYELSSSVIPVFDLLDKKGNVIFRYLSIELEDSTQYIYACN